MAHFIDKFRYKITDENVILSVTTNENIVTEHAIPIHEMIMMIESARIENDFQTNSIGVKFIQTGVILKLRENEYTRKIYKFSKNDFAQMLAKFRRSISIDFVPKTESEEDNTEEQTIANTIVKTVEPIVTSMFRSFASERVEILNLSRDLKQQVNDLQNYVMLLQQEIGLLKSQITDLPSQISVTNISEVHQKTSETMIDDDMPIYIPSKVKTDYEGKMITSVQQSEDQTIENAMNLLKQMKNKGKKNDKG